MIKRFFKKFGFVKRAVFKPLDPKIIQGKYGINYTIVSNFALDAHILKDGVYSDWIASQNLLSFEKNSVFFDIGANAGFLSLIFAKRYAFNGHVYSYEADPFIFDDLKRNIELNPSIKNIQIQNLALQGDHLKQTAHLNIRRAVDGDGNENRGLSSLCNLNLHKIDSVEVQCSTIDKEVSKMKLNRLDFIKVDVEGLEYDVLKGGHEGILKYSPTVLWEASVVIDRLCNMNNVSDTFNYLKQMNYCNFAIVGGGGGQRLEKIFSAPEISEDMNIIAFYQDKIPAL
jgi:FkbM family methyltransferase